jgi:hypothetical protein
MLSPTQANLFVGGLDAAGENEEMRRERTAKKDGRILFMIPI